MLCKTDPVPDLFTDDLSSDRPSAVELLEIIAETLSNDVVPATAPHAQHRARVAANLCKILARELATPATSSMSDTLARPLTQVDDATAAAAYSDVVALVQAKLAINKPGYDNHGAAEEAAIVR